MTRSKSTALTLLVLCELAVMALWFSATAVIPTLISEYQLDRAQSSLITSSVQAGFVAGTLLSAVFGLADRFDPRRFFMIAALVGAVANARLLLADPASLSFLVLRFITGACMAGVYPVGMKMAAGWAKGDLGLLVGLLVGALTLGSATPHLLNANAAMGSGLDWRFTIAAASVLALAGALCFIWGVAVVADSAQFSSAVAELSPPEAIGTMLTVQTSMGFLLTLATIHLLPPVVDLVGWRAAFAVLAIGPVFGIWCMWRLRQMPEAAAIAGGRR